MIYPSKADYFKDIFGSHGLRPKVFEIPSSERLEKAPKRSEAQKAFIANLSLVELISLILGILEGHTLPASQLALIVTGRIIRLLPLDSVRYTTLNQCYKL
jgi:hypothetical protein